MKTLLVVDDRLRAEELDQIFNTTFSLTRSRLPKSYEFRVKDQAWEQRGELAGNRIIVTNVHDFAVKVIGRESIDFIVTDLLFSRLSKYRNRDLHVTSKLLKSFQHLDHLSEIFSEWEDYGAGRIPRFNMWTTNLERAKTDPIGPRMFGGLDIALRAQDKKISYIFYSRDIGHAYPALVSGLLHGIIEVDEYIVLLKKAYYLGQYHDNTPTLEYSEGLINTHHIYIGGKTIEHWKQVITEATQRMG